MALITFFLFFFFGGGGGGGGGAGHQVTLQRGEGSNFLLDGVSVFLGRPSIKLKVGHH